jgi:hypothetical protein
MMKIATSYRAMAASLILVFGTFNVGIPIVKYLCPFMSAKNPACPMMAEHSSGPAFTFAMPLCCGSYIIAERNTTPYLHAEKYEAPSTIITNILMATDFVDLQPKSSDHVVPVNASPPLAEHIPLFVLHSTLLI